jgi:hypothetical protein
MDIEFPSRWTDRDGQRLDEESRVNSVRFRRAHANSPILADKPDREQVVTVSYGRQTTANAGLEQNASRIATQIETQIDFSLPVCHQTRGSRETPIGDTI